MTLPILKKIFSSLCDSEQASEAYQDALNRIGFMADPMWDTSLSNLGKLLQIFDIKDPVTLLVEKDLSKFTKFLATLKRHQLENINSNGWRLSFAGMIEFFILFKHQAEIDANFLVGNLNWDQNIADYFLSTAVKFDVR